MNKQPDLPIEIKTIEDIAHGLFGKKTNWIRQDYLEFLDSWISNI